MQQQASFSWNQSKTSPRNDELHTFTPCICVSERRNEPGNPTAEEEKKVISRFLGGKIISDLYILHLRRLAQAVWTSAPCSTP